MTQFEHKPVLAAEVLEGLALQPGAVILDGTVGLGGHAGLILEKTAPQGMVIGFDRDERNLALAREHLAPFGDRVRLVNDSFASMEAYGVPPLDGVLMDLGFSSVHVDDPERGFSFMHDGPLDMRYDTRQELTAAMVVNSWSKDDLAWMLRKYGEEPWAMKIAVAIMTARRVKKFTRTSELAELIEAHVRRVGKAHPATRTFQALRIVVNDELGEVERGLRSAVALLKPGGRLVVITFHSLEDRLVKLFMKGEKGLSIVTKRPMTATREEIVANPRSRSAKLRIATKI